MKFKSFIFTLLALLIASCTLQPLPELDEPGKEEGKLVTINVTVSPETRVAYDDVNRKLAWETGDTLLLAGYDGTTYKGSEKFHWTSSNSFQGIEVPGATTYKAYYPGEKVTLDANGNVQLAGTFWQQTQTGNGTTVHLGKKLLLYDEEANPINQIFNLVLKSSILKLVLSGIPQEVGSLQQLIYTVETAPGVFKSMTLDVTGVTFSAALDNITAFLAFNPAVVTNIAANGKVRITLLGEQPYKWSATSGGKDYTAGNRYTGTVTGGWTEIINPLSYVAYNNVNPDGNGFVTDLTACDVSGYFNWSDAVTSFNTNNSIPGYHLPSILEWQSVVPKDILWVRFNSTYTHNDKNENVIVQGININMVSDFRTTPNKVSYALRYKGTDMISAWKYEYVTDNVNKNHTHMKITSRNVLPSVTIDNIIANNGAFWNTGTTNDVVRYFPASGYMSGTTVGNRQTHGYFWSSTENSNPTDRGQSMEFNPQYAYSTNITYKTTKHTVRLFTNP